jgi:hypothetical protein
LALSAFGLVVGLVVGLAGHKKSNVLVSNGTSIPQTMTWQFR